MKREAKADCSRINENKFILYTDTIGSGNYIGFIISGNSQRIDGILILGKGSNNLVSVTKTASYSIDDNNLLITTDNNRSCVIGYANGWGSYVNLYQIIFNIN